LIKSRQIVELEFKCISSYNFDHFLSSSVYSSGWRERVHRTKRKSRTLTIRRDRFQKHREQRDIPFEFEPSRTWVERDNSNNSRDWPCCLLTRCVAVAANCRRRALSRYYSHGDARAGGQPLRYHAL